MILIALGTWDLAQNQVLDLVQDLDLSVARSRTSIQLETWQNLGIS